MTNLKPLPSVQDQQQIEQIALVVDAVLNSKNREYVELLKRKAELLEQNLNKSNEIITAQADNIKILKEIIEIKDTTINRLMPVTPPPNTTILDKQSSELVTLGRMTLLNIILSVACVASLVAIYINLT